MALSRRSGNRFQASIWPGFVDAMTALLLVLMFVLTIFMIVQFMLRETITGQDRELDQLTEQVMSLADALGLEQQSTARLESEVGQLDATLDTARSEAETQSALIVTLRTMITAQEQGLADAEARVTGFEAQVAALLAERNLARAEGETARSERDAARTEGVALSASVAELEAAQDTLMSEQATLQLALTRTRGEVDAQLEAARLAAIRREALDAMIADLRAQNAETEAESEALATEVAALETALSEEEITRMTDAAAAEALRARLMSADTELTAMTLALEQERQRAEDTLTLLAAAQNAEQELGTSLAAALLAQANSQDGLAAAEAALAAAVSEVSALEGVRESRDEIEARLAAAIAAQVTVDAALSATLTDIEARDRALADALAARLTAESATEEALNESERRAILLSAANRNLAQVEARSAEGQRNITLLNQQVAELRAQLGALQSLLDDSSARDVAADVQINALGAELNAALAQVAAEERRRRELEEAERIRLEAEALDLARYRSEFFGRVREILGDREGVRIVGDRFVFASEVLFASAEVQLSPEGRNEIARIAGILRSIGDEIPDEIDWVIRVDGHTDDVPLSGTGRYRDNWELSQARALSVVRYMIDSLDIPANRLAATGFGEYQPIASGETAEARAQNRRIELKLTER